MIRRLAALAYLAALLQSPLLPAQQAVEIEAVRQRAEAGDVAAMRALAEAHYLGRGGVAQDFAEAARWYQRLAKRGEVSAQTTLGLMYARGWGVERDLAWARHWWSHAAVKGDAGAQYNLGMVYFEGQGVARDLPQALHWLRQAAERGHVAAQHIVGLMYFDGKGTARDPVTGLMWLTIAAENGEEYARQELRAIGDDASAEQRAEARTRAQQWIKAHPAAR